MMDIIYFNRTTGNIRNYAADGYDAYISASDLKFIQDNTKINECMIKAVANERKNSSKLSFLIGHKVRIIRYIVMSMVLFAVGMAVCDGKWAWQIGGACALFYLVLWAHSLFRLDEQMGLVDDIPNEVAIQGAMESLQRTEEKKKSKNE